MSNGTDMAQSEVWRPVVGWEGLYEVSDRGRVRSLDRRVGTRRKLRRGRVLKATPRGTRGPKYPTVGLSLDGARKLRPVHQLVAEAFIGPAPTSAHLVRHGDGDPLNNAVANLQWGTSSDNAQDTVRHGNNPWAKRSHCSRGHEYTEATVRLERNRRKRVCRVCERLRQDLRKRRTAA